MAVAVGVEDGVELHVADTVAAGDGLVDPAAARVLATEVPMRLTDLVRWGARFDRVGGRDGELHRAREGGQSVARSVHRADATGAEIVRVLRSVASPRVRRVHGAAVALGCDAGRATGVWLASSDGVRWFGARAVLLATGGCGGLYAASTNQPSATGDGVALAFRAGAAVRDLEFVQFHPTGLATPGTWRLLLTEALRGAGATLHDAAGRRFLVDLHPDAELAPRHVVARAITRAGSVWLDARTLGAARLAEEFPTVLAEARRFGFDLATEPVPVTPAAHYMVGGVRTDLEGRTTVPGLWAAGEVASTGVHGANRMAGNSLAEALVFGHRAATTIAASLPNLAPGGRTDPPRLSAPLDPARLDDLWDRLRIAMWEGAGPVRNHATLTRCRGDLARLRDDLGAPSDVEGLELDVALATAGLVVDAALLRPETRGGHVRDDHPQQAAWDGVHLERQAPAAASWVGARAVTPPVPRDPSRTRAGDGPRAPTSPPA